MSSLNTSQAAPPTSPEPRPPSSATNTVTTKVNEYRILRSRRMLAALGLWDTVAGHAQPILDDAACAGRVAYCVDNPRKANLVEHAEHWPGVTVVSTLRQVSNGPDAPGD